MFFAVRARATRHPPPDVDIVVAGCLLLFVLFSRIFPVCFQFTNKYYLYEGQGLGLRSCQATSRASASSVAPREALYLPVPHSRSCSRTGTTDHQHQCNSSSQFRAPLVQHQQNTKQSPRLHRGTPRNVTAWPFKRTKAPRPDTKARTTTRHQVPFTRTARSKPASVTRCIRDAFQGTGSPHRITAPHRHQTSAPRHQAARRLEMATQGSATKLRSSRNFIKPLHSGGVPL